MGTIYPDAYHNTGDFHQLSARKLAAGLHLAGLLRFVTKTMSDDSELNQSCSRS